MYCELDGSYRTRSGNATCVPRTEVECETGTFRNGAGGSFEHAETTK